MGAKLSEQNISFITRLQHTGHACLQLVGVTSGLRLTSIDSGHTAWLIMHSSRAKMLLIVRMRCTVALNYSLKGVYGLRMIDKIYVPRNLRICAISRLRCAFLES